jgi:hypothetical protein
LRHHQDESEAQSILSILGYFRIVPGILSRLNELDQLLNEERSCQLQQSQHGIQKNEIEIFFCKSFQNAFAFF